DLAVRPGLPAEPFDDVVKIFLLVAVEKAKFAAGFAAAAQVHLRVDIATLNIEPDRPGFAPEKLRARRQSVVVVAVWRSRKHHRERPDVMRHFEHESELARG